MAWNTQAFILCVQVRIYVFAYKHRLCVRIFFQRDGVGFFTKRAQPFSDSDIRDPKPKVKQTPVMRYAQGTALFIQARSTRSYEEGNGALSLHALLL